MPIWNNRRLLWGILLALLIAVALPCLYAWQQIGHYSDRLWLQPRQFVGEMGRDGQPLSACRN